MATLVLPQYKQTFNRVGPLAGHPEDRLLLLEPRIPNPGGPLVIFVHGGTQNALTGVVAHPWIMEFLGRLCSLGITVLAPDMCDPTVPFEGVTGMLGWGNDYSVTRFNDWFNWAGSNLDVDASKVTILAYSMGCLPSINWTALHRDKVHSVTHWNPGLGLVAMRADRSSNVSPHEQWATYGPTIDVAWGVSSGDPLPDRANPYTNEALRGLKWRGYYSTNDPTVPASWATDMAAWTGGQAQAAGAFGHYPLNFQEPYTDFDEWIVWSKMAIR